MSTIERAIEIAMKEHFGQVDKNNVPYIYHPLRVMSEVALRWPRDTNMHIVAVLHDVIEDSPNQGSIRDLIRQEFGQEIYEALLLLSRDKNQPYETYIQAIAKSGNVWAIITKWHDLLNNTELLRIPKFDHLTRPAVDQRLLKYHHAQDFLQTAYINAHASASERYGL